jgi:NADPH:quinone reductase
MATRLTPSDENKAMKAILHHAFGDPSVLQLQDVPVPTLKSGEALVRVVAAGVNFADVVMRRGDLPIPLPNIPGVEGAGVVEAIAPDVTDFKTGDRVAWAPVLAAANTGSYAQYQAVHREQLLPLPDDLSFEHAAAVTLRGLTAHYLVHDQFAIQNGTTVLVHAAAGGMGLMLVQWLKRLGATVIGTVSTESKAEQARKAGADHIVFYAREDFVAKTLELTGGRGADYIIDGVGRATFSKNLDAVAPRGKICIFGHASGFPDPISPLQLIPKSISISGGYMTNFLRTRAEVLGKAREVFDAVREGWLSAGISAVFPLEQAAQAHARLEQRESSGKLILAIE